MQFTPHHVAIFFFFNDTATTEIYTLSLHDALPIWAPRFWTAIGPTTCLAVFPLLPPRSEEHTSELQSLTNLVCRLLLEKKKKRLCLLARHGDQSQAAASWKCGVRLARRYCR